MVFTSFISSWFGESVFGESDLETKLVTVWLSQCSFMWEASLSLFLYALLFHTLSPEQLFPCVLTWCKENTVVNLQGSYDSAVPLRVGFTGLNVCLWIKSTGHGLFSLIQLGCFVNLLSVATKTMASHRWSQKWPRTYWKQSRGSISLVAVFSAVGCLYLYPALLNNQSIDCHLRLALYSRHRACAWDIISVWDLMNMGGNLLIRIFSSFHKKGEGSIFFNVLNALKSV